MSTRILQVFFKNSYLKDLDNYIDFRDLFLALKDEQEEAIKYLYSRTSKPISQLGKQHKLVNEDIEELICDSITLLIIKIRNGEYIFAGNDPASYVIEIAKRKALNYWKKAQKNSTSDIEFLDYSLDEDELCNSEETDKLKYWLSQLSENCQNLIKLKYFDNLKDKDVIESKLTNYADSDTLKNLRGRCLKQLLKISKQVKENKEKVNE